MANQQRRGQARAGEARAGGGRPDGPDVNKDRLIFCITSLIGQKVTASLRNNVQYEGTFHSCALDGDYSITLKSARRLPSESNNKSGEVVPTLVVAGKDFLQVSAMNVPPLSAEEGRKGFATDAEISRKEGESHRDLVPWQADGYAPQVGGLEEGGHDGKWDQFSTNEKMYGVSTTWHEDFYTTKLDKSQVPQDKRDKAEQIAREIESGNMHTEVEDRVDGDGDGDEEARFSAAQPLGGNNTKALAKPLPQVPERQDMAAMQDRSGRKGMISEMKRINALNLEPTSAKHDESTARSRMSMKDAASRNAQRLQGNSADLKSEFQQSLEIIAQQDAKKRGKNPEQQWEGQNSQNQKGSGGGGAMVKAGDQSRGQSGSFSFNPKAPSFTLNPQAGEFMPGGAQAQTPAKASGPSPSFSTYSKKPSGKAFKGGLADILEMFFQRAKNSAPDSAAPDWPDAKGPSYKDVLGQPNQSGQRAVQGANAMHMQNMANAGNWQTQNQGQQGGQQAANQVQQQQQVPQQNAPQNQDQQQAGPNMVGQGGVPMGQPTMMPQGFAVVNAPGPGQGGNQPNQMQQYGNMYGGPGQQGQPHQGQGMGQPTIVFNQAPVMGQGGSQMVPMIAQGQQGQMGMTAPVAKFPGQQQQMFVVPIFAGPNQYGNGQGMTMQGPMQGQGTMPPQGGGPQGDGGQGQMMQQNMYPRQQ